MICILSNGFYKWTLLTFNRSNHSIMLGFAVSRKLSLGKAGNKCPFCPFIFPKYLYWFYWLLNFNMLRYPKIKFDEEIPREGDMKGEYIGYNKLTGRALH